jgi:hypothetical protein
VGGLGLVGYLLAFLGTLMAAGDWWYETFITPMLRSRVPGDFRGGTAYLGSYQRVCDVRGVRCGVVDLWILQLPAGIFPRGASILMMLGRSGRTSTTALADHPLSLTLDRPGSPQVDLREDWHPQPPGTPRPNLLRGLSPAHRRQGVTRR